MRLDHVEQREQLIAAAMPGDMDLGVAAVDDSSPRRSSWLITRDTAVSLPGIGVADRRIVSPSVISTYLCRPWAISDSAAKGSPWLPVVIKSWCSGGSLSSSTMSIISSGGAGSRRPSSGPTVVLRWIDRPKMATWRSGALPPRR